MTQKEPQPKKIHDYMDTLHLNFEFIPTLEDKNRISFLYLLISRQPSTIETDIYRKSTSTDTTINFNSNHPTEHKLAAYRYVISRIIYLPLSPEKHKTEWQTILTIANNKMFPLSVIKKLK
jgi:hypothetical protein